MAAGAQASALRSSVPRSLARQFSIDRLWAFLAVALPVAAGLGARLQLTDLAYQIRAGDMMLGAHAILRTDPFTFTEAARPWLNQQWGSEVVFGGLFRLGEWPLLVVARASLMGAVCWLVFRSCREAGAGRRTAGLLTLAAFIVAGVSTSSFALRPQLLAEVLFAATLLILSVRGKSPRLVWLVPAIAAVWANVHGSFFLVPALVLLAWVQDRSHGGPGRHRLLVVVAVSAAATLVNPFGLGVWKYSAGLIADPLLPRFVSEWQPPSLRDPAGAAFFLSVALVVLVLARRHARVEWSSLMWLGSFLFLGLAATRGIVWWVLVAPVVLSGLLQEGNESRSPVPETQDRSPAMNLAIAGIALAVMVSLLPWWRDTPSASSGPLLGGIPVGITTYLQRSAPPGTRLFAPDGWASWFELSVPNRPVFVDSRIELFPAHIWMQYQSVFFAQEGWERVLDRWKVDVLIVDAHADSPLARSVARSSGWRVVYRDSDGLVAERAV